MNVMKIFGIYVVQMSKNLLSAGAVRQSVVRVHEYLVLPVLAFQSICLVLEVVPSSSNLFVKVMSV